jgi:hypothetical protein
MNDINILNNFFLYRVITQVAYISEKHPDLSYYDLDTCELVIVDSGEGFVDGHCLYSEMN